MLTTERDKRICDKYSQYDSNGKVHCAECPLVKNAWLHLCKANSHYDRHIRDWDIDEFGKPYEVEGKNYGV